MSYSQQEDPFTGAWTCNSQRSTLSTPPPGRWTQRIDVTTDEVTLHEAIVSSDGAQSIVAVRARFDGQDDPVSGSPVADTIAYTRVNTHTISGTAKKNGNISIRETLTASPEGPRTHVDVFGLSRRPRAGKRDCSFRRATEPVKIVRRSAGWGSLDCSGWHRGSSADRLEEERATRLRSPPASAWASLRRNGDGE
jgi:hypothetical protein